MKQKFSFKNFFTKLFIGVAALFSATTPALAQIANNLDVSISPPTVYLSVKPGGTLQHTVILENHSNQRLELTGKLVNFSTDGKTGRPILGNGSIFDQLLSKQAGLNKPFILEPNQTKQWQIKLNINPTAAQKEYPMTLLFTAKPAFRSNAQIQPNTQIGSSSQVQAVIGSNIILLISPNNSNKGQIELGELKYKKIIDSLASLKFGALAKNTGSNAINVEGEIIIKNLMNKTTAEYIIYPDMILAGSTREIRVLKKADALFNEEGKLEPEQNSPLLNQLIYKKPFLFGIYSIELKLNQEVVVTQILAFPFSLLIAGLVGAAIFVGFQKIKERY